jgi:hypothetical protein
MSSASDAKFCQLLKTDIEYLKHRADLFEDLLPFTSAPVQDQWRLQAQARRNFVLELEILLRKASSPQEARVSNLRDSGILASCCNHSESALS